MIKEEKLLSLRKYIKEKRPLVHCITNPISINGCANMILAVGARPIMAEHPLEVEEITSSAEALMLNLGNITDVRMESMKRSLRTARERKIPVILDLVGISCSRLRREFAQELYEIGGIWILKGNISELLTAAGLPSHSIGVDAGKEDALGEHNFFKTAEAFNRLARTHGCVVMASGKEDLIADGSQVYLVGNGGEMLSGITGSGCMQGALGAAFLTGKDPLHAAVLGAVLMGEGGELAQEQAKGPGSFQAALLDEIAGISDSRFLEMARIRQG